MSKQSWIADVIHNGYSCSSGNEIVENNKFKKLKIWEEDLSYQHPCVTPIVDTLFFSVSLPYKPEPSLSMI